MADNPRRVLPPTETGPPDPPPARAHRTGPFGVVDIGSTKVACLIGRMESDGSLRVLGFGWQKGRGINSGDITDLDAAEKAIRACVGQAEDMADVRLRAVTVNLSCGQPESRLFNVQWPVGGRAVSEDDIRGVVMEGRHRSEVDGREPIHVLPLNFAVDSTDHVVDPRGLFCTTLNARLHVIDSLATSLRSLEACIARCDLDIEDLVSSPMVAGLSTLVPEERDLGATIIDMGGGTTSMAVFADNQIMHTAQLAIGGQHVTRDLAIGLSTTLAHAERLKTLYGNVEASPDDDRELLPVPLVGEEDHQLAKVPRSMVVNIIRPRLEETFEYIKDRLDSTGMARAAGNRVVLTGGACQLPGVREMAARMLSRQVRLGRPGALRGLPELATGPAFATAAGLLAWAGGEGRAFQDINLEDSEPIGLFRRLVNFLKDRV
ncbi:cell division protein FtsA [Rhodopila sp.]|jgi:cell division protein FtsA|uniref:cell division protein FtsA n=1 Tax=Rhodopila sp. TaxID=2480087 RepID=UPI002C53BF01|nr:cell division protein FtsA [Rhodopila sp.]HVZ08901.1 cell division protein FtsA [Rhodopila sp.]